ncbi:ATP-binding cassette domain-containing protein [Azospirillum doebereinerae]|uniref:ATP-binding protein Uup n=1 Tax=Azospirillum doebereinerae TaxID=92933 RepID=A0A3S0WPJ2_9PROT|nr:ATP-binding cassette domain-containing protein [Azospirillum doebereinerae]MCG5242196.1 ATP-binding cassette domain-containing protein [Azospirillum doebereinerae]RUQ75583.1 ATP-binding cassette domain-containing protein [Azospirillum doebereinerae]
MAPPAPITALQGVSVTFGGRPLFESIDVSIGRGDRACLVGRNGSGKSTLMKVLAGLILPDGGTVFTQPGARIAYLPQEPDYSGCATVQDYVVQGLPADERDEAHRVDAVLDRLQVAGDRDPLTLSGGESRRTALARTLVGNPDIMLLDEPTNHLDLPTIEWLEGELLSFRGGLLLISHDRAFLNRLAKRTLWLDRGTVRATERGFSEFEAWQAEVFESEEAAAHKLDRKIEAETKWMREGISARRTRNMGRVRNLQALRGDRAERIRGGQQAKLAVAEAERGGRLVIEATNIAKGFDTAEGGRKTIVQSFSTRILRGDRVGLIGPNGAGKSTLLKMLTGQLEPDEGTVKLGTNLDTAYFDQRREGLDPEDTIRKVLCPFGGDAVMVNGQSRHVAGYIKDFLFDTRQLDSPVKALSGGERNRLLLARLFAKPSNMMILDEPTNDLDMDTLDLLEDVLGDYQGTLLLVSHDRDFLDRLVTGTIAMEGDGTATEYAGGYSDYLVQRPAKEPSVAAPAKAKPAAVPAAAKPRGKLTYKDQRELDDLPGRMDKLSAEIAKLETAMADPDLFTRDPAKFQKTSDQLHAKQAELGTAEERWLELEALREELEGGR